MKPLNFISSWVFIRKIIKKKFESFISREFQKVREKVSTIGIHKFHFISFLFVESIIVTDFFLYYKMILPDGKITD